MIRSGPVPARLGGFSMIEVLVSLLIIVFGLLGLAGLHVRIQQSEFESYQRAQALVLLQDMVERIHLHRVAATCFRFPNTRKPRSLWARDRQRSAVLHRLRR